MENVFNYSGRYTIAYSLTVSEVNELLNQLSSPKGMILVSMRLTPRNGLFDVELHFRSIKMLR